MITSFFFKFLVKFLRDIKIKYVVLRAGSDALSGALNVALLRAITVQSAFLDDAAKVS